MRFLHSWLRECFIYYHYL